jgi:ribonuclease HII
MPDYALEEAIRGHVAGVDEAGRGPWAGPVVAAAVILRKKEIPSGLRDSKKLSAKKREALFPIIMQQAWVGIGVSEVEEIDRMNILEATLLAMRRAVAALPVSPDKVLVDGNVMPRLNCPTETIIGGDDKSLSIAAASIVAKVTRDNIMAKLHHDYPQFGWLKNAGYGTADHIAALNQHGPTPLHRKSFKPIKALLMVSES